MEYILLTLGISTQIWVWFYLGKLHERWEWNQLIKAGKIPSPKK